MKSLTETMLKALEDPGIVFVFPSEVAAAFWRKKILLLSGRSAVRTDRFISWDSFKERVEVRREGRKPVNKFHRLLFADQVCAQNAHTPFLEALIPVPYSDQSPGFTDYIGRVLNQLYVDSLPVYEHPLVKKMDVPLMKDLKTLDLRYRQFLDTHRLFEPSRFNPEIALDSRSYIIFFTGILEDFGRYEPYLPKSGISVPRMDFGGSVSPELREFSNGLQEIRWVCAKTAELLDREPMDGIVFTTPSRDSLQLLKEEAALYNLPLSIQWGEPLSALPAGRFFRQLKTCESSGYGINAFKNLLLTKNFPWLFREKNISLIRFGHDFFCLRNYRSEGSFKNVWEYNLKRTNNTELLDYYRKLTSMIGSLLKAASFSQLKTRLVQFTMEFFNQEEWDPEHRQVFERCIRLCDSLGETAEALPGIELSNPYAIFLLCLDRQEYVRQSRGSGIQVYPYRVSAGIYPASHFIFGLSAGDTNVRMERFTYLRSDQKTAAGLEDRDMTFPFLDVYGSSGEQVYCSYGRETQSGVKLPPGYFLDSLSRQSDPEWPLRREREYWAERISDLPPKLFPVLKKGLGFYHDTGWKKTGPDLSVEGSENADIALLARNALVDGEGYVHVSPSSLERFNSCPFSWLLSRVCGLEEEAVPDEFSDPAITGTLYHLVMRDLYETLKERSGMLESAQLGRYEALLKETFRATFSDWERFKPVFPEPLWREVRETILQDTLACLEAEIEEFDGYGIFSTEMKLAWKDSVKNVEYSGKVDRILSHNDSFYLTDYKKTLHFRQRQLQIPEDGGPPASSQIPFYLFLMEKNGYSAEGAGYFSFSDGKSIPVYAAQTDKKAWFYPETLKPLLERVEKDTQRLIDAVNRGSFPAVPSEAACRYCGLERLCRKKFSVR